MDGYPPVGVEWSPQKITCGRLIPAGPDPLAQRQGCVNLPAGPHQESADPVATVGALAEPHKDERLTAHAFDLEPIATAARPVERIASAGHFALKREVARLRAELLARGPQIIDVADTAGQIESAERGPKLLLFAGQAEPG